MVQILKNNVSGVLASGIGATTTTMTLVDASKFPAPSSNDFYLLTLVALNANGHENKWEVVKVTSKASNTLTVVRAQEGTSGQIWEVGTVVQMRLTAGSVVTPSGLAAHTDAADPHPQYTHPTSHPPSIITQDANNRFVTDAEKTAWNSKADGTHTHSAATTSAAGFLSAADKTKLDGIAAGANNYTHPASHPPSIITQDASNRFVTDAEKTAWNSKQAALASGTNIKTVNGQSLLGAGDVVVSTTYDEDFRRITNPGGAKYISGGATGTGAIAITLPVFVNAMVQMTVKVFDYAAGKSFTVVLGGYTYQDASYWINTFAYITSQPSVNRQHSVRFGVTATNKPVVYIGELSSVWAYPQVFVTDVQIGHTSQPATWLSGWSIAISSAGFQNVNSTVTDPQIGSRFTPIGYSPGAGGIVYQAVSKNESVYLNKPCGTVVMHDEALPAKGVASFVVYTSHVGMSDVVVVSFDDTSVGGYYYDIKVPKVRIGMFAVLLTNISDKGRAENIAFNFTVIKGASA